MESKQTPVTINILSLGIETNSKSIAQSYESNYLTPLIILN